MNGSRPMALGLCGDLLASIELLGDIDVVLCPPSTLLSTVADQLKESDIRTGAQDIGCQPAGRTYRPGFCGTGQRCRSSICHSRPLGTTYRSG